MAENRKSYRIRTAVGNEAPSSVSVSLNQTFDVVDVLSLEIDQKNFYKMPSAGYGVIVGRVIANGGFGVPNAKVSVFVPYDRNLLVEDGETLYHYTTPLSKGSDGIRYNLLPRHLDEPCHQDIGSMYEKEYMLDNRDLIKVFEKYYKYTTVTNDAGDYFIYGVPVGTQTLHVDLDLSDIGALSQRPRDMMYKGYNVDMFDSPNKFKKDKNLNNLAQVYSQDNVVNVYPFWGDTSLDETNGVITRCDINIDYTFEPTCVFIGSIVTDTGDRAISQRCVPDDEIGKMSELVTGEGKIEMIRKTFDGKVEEFAIKANNLIDGDGVWCYQIPMNLDYVMTDEFGKMVPTDDPSKGIPTRACVRFRIWMNEIETDDTARKRARFLVPNNPKLNDEYPDFSRTHEADYEFGSFTKDESYRDLFWNKVYTVKSYIPRLQKAKALRRRVHTGIKNVNHSGGNNPFPFNNLFVRLTFTYRFLCTLLTLFCVLVYSLNTVLNALAVINYYLGKFFAFLGSVDDNMGKFLALIVNLLLGFLPMIFDTLAFVLLKTSENMLIKLPNFCDDGNFDQAVYVPMGTIGNISIVTIMQKIQAHEDGYEPIVVQNPLLSWLMGGDTYVFPTTTSQNYSSDLSRLFNCVENQLAQDQECTSFNFSNDWVNGVLYAPLWYRKVRSKKKIFFGLFTRKAKDKWCDGTSKKFAKGLSLCQTCAQKRDVDESANQIKALDNSHINFSWLGVPTPINEKTCYGYKCHKKAVSFINLSKGLIIPVETTRGDEVYYYKSVEYDDTLLYSQYENGKLKGDIKMLFATDIVLLGSLNDCDKEGVPQFFKRLESTTYNMPPDLVLMDYDSNENDIEFEEKHQEETSKLMSLMNFGDNGLADIGDEINESGAIDPDSIYTDKTGADWGNYGKDQVTPEYAQSGSYIESADGEAPDIGGLFYGLTCWSAYTKPKSCVNLSRICEYGVSLDQSQDNPVYDSQNDEYATMAPDGFISYDELYDKDGRAMFATMNGNNLRTKTNPSNGFPVYDFMYLYPDNFDGTLKNLMNPSVSPYDAPLPNPQSKNYKAEENSAAYILFRYGRNRYDEKIQFYKSESKIGLYDGFDQINWNRFPKYENSFYFYFGLNPGNTAIDKFRTQFYSDCNEDEGEQAVVGLDYEGNSWCSEVSGNGEFVKGDGWVKIDATYVDAPYDLRFVDVNGNEENNLEINGITDPKVYIAYAGQMPEFENEGYVRLLDDSDPQNPEAYGLMNGSYRLAITDANNGVITRMIEFTQSRIEAVFGRAPFRLSNDALRNYGNLNVGDFYTNVATLGGHHNEDMSDRTDIGGFIEVTNILMDGEAAESFSIQIQPLFSVDGSGRVQIFAGASLPSSSQTREYVGYNGSYMEVHQGNTTPVRDDTLMNISGDDLPPYCPYYYRLPNTSGKYDFRFGVPVGGKRYQVTVTMLCSNENGTYFQTRNSTSSIVTVPEPIKFKMLLNDTDYSIISNFQTGWHFENGMNFPENYVPDSNLNNVKGWLDMDNVDGLEILATLNEGEEYLQPKNYENYIQDTESKLNGTYSGTTPYNWNGVYLFDSDELLSEIGKYDTIPTTRQSGVAFILVLYHGDYVFYKWDDNNGYVIYEPQGSPVQAITTKEYYDESDRYTKNDFIERLNNITYLRFSFIETLKNSFVLRNSDLFYLKVGHQTYETPVSTLIYYSPDGEYGTENEFIPLSDDYDEDTCDSITTPTLTGLLFDVHNDFNWNGSSNTLRNLGVSSFQPIGSGQYKKPYLTAIENAINETLPVPISEISGGIRGNINDVSKQMFGVHIVDKRLRYAYNSWAPMSGWPMYNETDTTTNTGTFFSVDGLFSGFVLDGRPRYEGTVGDSGIYPATFFSEQRLDGENFNVVTLSLDANGDVDENRVPVVRFIYASEPDNIVYSDYTFTIGHFDDMIDDEICSNSSCLEGCNHLLVHSLYSQIFVRDGNGTSILPLYDEVVAPNLYYIGDSYNALYYAYVTFNEGSLYTFYKGTTNPVYTKGNSDTCMIFSNAYITSGQPVNGTMYFMDSGFNFDENNEYVGSTVIVNGNLVRMMSYPQTVGVHTLLPILSLYCVKISNDGYRRVVSKTYDFTRMFYHTSADYYQTIPDDTPITNPVNVYVGINIGFRDYSNPSVLKHGFYYLRNYDFTVTFEDEEVGTLAQANVEGGYMNGNVTINPPMYNVTETDCMFVKLREFEVGTMSGEINDYLLALNGNTCNAYITDITGLRKKMLKCDFSDMNFTYTSISNG